MSEPPLRSVDVTPHEFRLLEALRANPNRREMWVGRGDPMVRHQKLVGLYRRFFEVMNQYSVSYWLEYGSVLGYVRHGGIIPWEWDMDVGVLPEEFKRLREVVGPEVNASDPDYIFEFYKDPDYESKAFAFYLRADPEVLCDICEYRQEGDELVCVVEDWHYPNHKVSDILPPKPAQMLGQKALLPANPSRFLKKAETILGQCTGAGGVPVTLNTIPYMQYDPVPFLLCHLFHPEFIEKASGPPVVDVPEVASIKEGFEKYAALGLPFICRGCRGFELSLDAFRAKAAAEGTTAFGWDAKWQCKADIPILGALEEWEAGKLAVNFIDSAVPKMVPNDKIHQDLRDVGIDEDNLCLVLSNFGTYTSFHQDPAVPTEEGVAGGKPGGYGGTGGGWMYLVSGEKLWQYLEFKHSDFVYDKETQAATDPHIEDLVYADNHALWGKVHSTIMRAGDFIYSPPYINHRVWTYEKSFGVGGYASFPGESRLIQAAVDWYKANGLDPAAGLLKKA